MSLMTITADSLTREFAREVPPIYVVIAKHSVLGMTNDQIQEVIGCEEFELQAILDDQLYKDVRLFVGAAHSQQTLSQTLSWDTAEDLALEQLVKRLPYERDGDFLLRVAAVANKAQRRHKGNDQNVLDPSRAAGGRTITLTRRMVQQFTRDDGSETRAIEHRLSIHDGSMSNPKFEEVDALLDVRTRPALPQRVEITSHLADPSLEELDEFMKGKDDGSK